MAGPANTRNPHTSVLYILRSQVEVQMSTVELTGKRIGCKEPVAAGSGSVALWISVSNLIDKTVYVTSRSGNLIS